MSLWASQRILHRFQQKASFVDGAKIRWLRDRGLDHAVEKEKHLIPFLLLKDFIGDDGVQLPSVNDNRRRLSLPFRPIDFIRLFPFAFTEDQCPIPTIRPTPDLLRLHHEEISLYADHDADAADRLLRLLMLSRNRSLPLSLLHSLRFDLALPRDFPLSLLPRYPHYFRLDPTSAHLDLVCWDHRLAVPAFLRHRKPPSTAFPLHYSQGFIMDKKVARWMEDWQNLPYLSPYDEEGPRLDPKSPLAEKWTVGVLHELLHLLVPKKTARDNLMLLADLAGLRPPTCKKLIDNYPGIFYVSNKNDMHTVVLREAYKRGTLADKHPLMEIRYKYIHLMHKPKREENVGSGKDRKKKLAKSVVADHTQSEEEEEQDDEDEDDEEEEDCEDSEFSEFLSDDDDDDDNNISTSAARMSMGGAVANDSVRTTRERTVETTAGRYGSIEARLKTRKASTDPGIKRRRLPHPTRTDSRSQGSQVRSQARRRPVPNARM